MKTSNRISNVFRAGGRGAIVIALILLLSSLNTNSAKAQCPTGWNYSVLSTTVTCPSGTCNVSFGICWRIRYGWPTTSTNTYETKLTGDIILSGSCDCASLWTEVFHAVNEKIVQSASTFAPPCGQSGYNTLKIVNKRSACFQYEDYYDINNVLIGTKFVACGNPAIKCVQTCDICYEYGHVSTSNCVYTTEGGDPDCDPPPVDGWTTSDTGCYLVCDAH